MAPKLTNDERDRILELCHQGLSCQQIAQQVNRSPGTISNVAKAAGHRFGHTNAVRARDARSGYAAERRAKIAQRAIDEAELLLDQLHEPHLAFSFGGKDNTYAEHEMAEPPVESKRALVQSFRELMRTVLDIDRHDNKADEGAAVVDDWLRSVIGESVQSAV